MIIVLQIVEGRFFIAFFDDIKQAGLSRHITLHVFGGKNHEVNKKKNADGKFYAVFNVLRSRQPYIPSLYGTGRR